MREITIQQSSENQAKTQRTGFFASNGFAQIFVSVVDLIFPPRCAGCGKVDTPWCAGCQADLETLTPIFRQDTPEYLQVVAATGWHTGKLQQAIHALKYDNAQSLAAYPLGERLTALLDAQHWTIDMLIPVPLHAARMQERGYNQAQLLGEYIAANRMIPCRPDAIQRIRSTRSQVGLNAAERAENVLEAFSAAPELVVDQTILLIDDVYTTGATLTACAQAALAAGARAVYGLTLSSAHN